MTFSFFHLSDIPGCENSFSVKWKHFFYQFFNPASENGKSIFLFRAMLKLLKFGGGNSCLWKLIFWLAELIFYHFSDTPSNEIYFPSGGNVSLSESSNPYGRDAFSVLCKSFSFYKWKPSLKFVETYFLGERIYSH